MRYGIISDIHSDIVSLQKVLLEFQSLNVEQMFCCGDTVGYGLWPQEVINLLMEDEILSVMGNHDKALFDEEEYSKMKISAQQAINDNLDFINAKGMLYIKALPEFLIHENIRIVHGIPPNSYTNYLHDLAYGEIRDLFKLYDEQIVFCGHTHLCSMVDYDGNHLVFNKDIDAAQSYTIESDKRYIINVGSVSSPRHPLKKNKSQFVIYDSDKELVKFHEI